VPAATRSYWALSRAPRYSILFALPLLLAYEALAAALGDGGTGVRNGADVIVKTVFIAAAGPRGPLWFAGLLTLACGALVVRDMRRTKGGLSGRIFLGMMAESIALASIFGVVVGTITVRLLTPFGVMAMAQVQELGPVERLLVSLGAGLYEELLFRVILVGALVALGTKLLGWGPRLAACVAVVVGALVFSAFHYVGPFGDPLELSSFTFRAIGGLAFSALYVTRGFGITAWTHALYDVFLLVV
jgi:hypothetical protein